MTSQSFTEQEKTDLIQALKASIHRLRGKIGNYTRSERCDLKRVQIRKESLERCNTLILKINGEEEKDFKRS